jgi:hypothetical protein
MLKYHMAIIYRKLGIQTRSEALVLAAKNNLIELVCKLPNHLDRYFL